MEVKESREGSGQIFVPCWGVFGSRPVCGTSLLPSCVRSSKRQTKSLVGLLLVPVWQSTQLVELNIRWEEPPNLHRPSADPFMAPSHCGSL